MAGEREYVDPLPLLCFCGSPVLHTSRCAVIRLTGPLGRFPLELQPPSPQGAHTFWPFAHQGDGPSSLLCVLLGWAAPMVGGPPWVGLGFL